MKWFTKDAFLRIGKGYLKLAGNLLGFLALLFLTDAIWRLWTGTPF